MRITRIWSYLVCRATSAESMTEMINLISLMEGPTVVCLNLLEWILTLPMLARRLLKNESRLKALRLVRLAVLMPPLSNRYGLTFVPLIDSLVRV